MKKTYTFFRGWTLILMTLWVLSPVMKYVWSVNKLLWWILALPVMYMFINALQLLDLVFLLFGIEEWVIVAELKRREVFRVDFLGRKITVSRVFYVCRTPEQERIASVLRYGTGSEEKDCLYAYRPTLKRTKVVLDSLAILLLFLKIMICVIFILVAGPLLEGVTTRLLQLLPE